MAATSQPSSSPVVVAYLGPEASYTHQAWDLSGQGEKIDSTHALCRRKDILASLHQRLIYMHQAAQKAYPDRSITQLSPRPTIPSLFQTIQDARGQTPTLAVCPIENSTNGPVAATLDLFADPSRTWPDVRIVAEIRVPVRHCLIVSADFTSLSTPSSTLALSGTATGSLATADFHNGPSGLSDALKQHLLRVQTLYTHPQAWGQCTRFLTWLDEARLSQGSTKVRRVDTSSTSHAASIVAGAGPAHTKTNSTVADADSDAQADDSANRHEGAAISSAATLALHPGRLAILLTGLEDSTANVTRFVVLANQHAVLPAQPQPQTAAVPGSGAKQKALVTFSLTSQSTGAGVEAAKAHKPPPPGALAKSLAVFEQWGMTLTSIAARPSGRAPWDYVFVVEVEMIDNGQSPGDQASGLALVERALQDVRAVAGEARCCGVWWFDEGEPL